MGARGPAPSSRRVGRGRGQPAAQLQGCGRLLTHRPPRRRRRLLRLVAGGTGAPSGAGEPALPFAAAAAISAFSGREGGGAPRLQLERAPLRGRSSPPRSACLLPAPPAPCALRVQPGPARGKVGAAGAGRGRGSDAHPEESPGLQRPGVQGAPRPGPRSSRGRKGLQQGRGGGVAGVGLGVPALSCGARRLQVQFLLPRAPRSQRRTLGPGAAEPARSLGAEDTPALVEKTFPADSVVAAVAGSRAEISPLTAPPALRGIRYPAGKQVCGDLCLAPQQFALQGRPAPGRAAGQGVGRGRVVAPETR